MKSFLKKHGKDLTFAAVLFVALLFIINIVTLGRDYSGGVRGQAAERARFATSETAFLLQKQIDGYTADMRRLAVSLSDVTDEETLYERLSAEASYRSMTDESFKTFYYISDGTLFHMSGAPSTEYPDLTALATASGDALSKVFQYENILMSVGVSAEVNNDVLQRIICVYDRSVLMFATAFADSEDGARPESVENSAFTLLCKADGHVLDRVENTADFSVGTKTVTEGILKTLLTDGDTYKEVVGMISHMEEGAVTLRVGTEEYILTVRPLGGNAGGLFLLSLYRAEAVYGDGYRLMRLIWGTLLVFSIVVTVLCISFVARQIDAHRRVASLALENEALDCPTTLKFEKEMKAILERNRVTNYSVVIVRVSNFDFIVTHFGAGAEHALLRHMRNVCHTSLLLEETYAYGSGGDFWLLLHTKDRKTLTDRLTVLEKLVTEGATLDDKKYTVNLSFNIYEIERGKDENVRHIMDKALTVRDMCLNATASSYHYYGDVVRETYMQKAEIEGRMERALENCEFHLFYQPKYNMHTGTLDGSEILVRWFDPQIGTYRRPGDFLKVFEETGFISKMDRFVFYRACENIAERIADRKTVYPISVNVSRVTAIQPDFLAYYKRIKEKFGIRDNFVTLEFTESFAYENYEYLSFIVGELHAAGFYCSLDDFGTGYSSFTPLKQLPMDEIKLDMAFLEKGISGERDDAILKSVIDLVRTLGIKVTQEGVSSKEEFDRMAALGCDVIQGYYFAKPMKYASYLEFLKSAFPSG